MIKNSVGRLSYHLNDANLSRPIGWHSKGVDTTFAETNHVDIAI